MRSAMIRQTVPTPGASARAAATATSAASTAPPGPEPRSARTSTPRSCARRRAFGDAAPRRAAVPSAAGATDSVRLSTCARTSAFSIRPPDVFTRARSTPCCSASLRARGDALIAAAAGGDGAAAGSPGARISAIVLPTGTTSPARAVTSCSTPDAGASISTVTLSVSISTIGSPFLTVSPGALSQRRTLPVSCASSSAGMMTLAGIATGSRLPAERLRDLEDGLLRRHGEVLEHRRERHRHVHGADAPHRRVEVIEGALGDHRRDLGGDAVALVALVHDEGARGLLGRLDQRRLVERPGRARVDHLGADAGVLEQLGGAEGDRHHAAGGDDGDVRAHALHLRHAEGDRVVLGRHRALYPV